MIRATAASRRFYGMPLSGIRSCSRTHKGRGLPLTIVAALLIGFETRGYVSDSGRAYFLGEPDPLRRPIADAYHAAHEAVKKEMRPGARVGDLYDMAADMAEVTVFPNGGLASAAHKAKIIRTMC